MVAMTAWIQAWHFIILESDKPKPMLFRLDAQNTQVKLPKRLQDSLQLETSSKKQEWQE